MLEQFVAVMPGTLAPALLVMCLSVMLAVGEGRDKPSSAHWRLIGLIVGLIAAIVFASLRASAVINQRTFVNYPVLWCAIIADILAIIVVVFARRITTNWQRHKAIMHIANAIAAIDIALTLFYALPDVILQLTIWVEPGDPIFTSDMLLRALGFALGLAMSIIVAAIFRTLRSTAVRASFTAAVLAVMVILFIQHLTGVMQILQARGFPMGHTAFVALAWSINHNSWMIMAQAFVFLIPAVASVVAGFRMPLTGANEAIGRKHKAFRRCAVASAVWSLVAMIGVTLTLTVGVAATQQTITLSPPEATHSRTAWPPSHSAKLRTAICTALNTRPRTAPSCALSSSRRTVVRMASVWTPARTVATPAITKRMARSSARSARWPSTWRPSASRVAATRFRSRTRPATARSPFKPPIWTR